jgi:hypothetical protein
MTRHVEDDNPKAIKIARADAQIRGKIKIKRRKK